MCYGPGPGLVWAYGAERDERGHAEGLCDVRLCKAVRGLCAGVPMAPLSLHVCSCPGAGGPRRAGLATYVGKLVVWLSFGLEGGGDFCVKQRCERLWSFCVWAWPTSACNSLKTPEELVRVPELMASLLASSLPASPGGLCFDIFLNSPLHVSCFHGSSPFAVFFPVSVCSPRCCSHWLFW